MLDVEDFIEERGGNPAKIKESQKRRGASVELVDEIIELWKVARSSNYEVSQIGTRMNNIQKEIGQKRKAKEDTTDLQRQREGMVEEKKRLEDVAAEKQKELIVKVRLVGNYVHASVATSLTEDDNSVERKWAPEGWDPAKPPGKNLAHHNVLWRLNGYDPIRGVKLVGHRGYCLTGYGMFLFVNSYTTPCLESRTDRKDRNQALINYAAEFLFHKGYTPNQPPYFLDASQMAKTAQLSQFDEELYKVSEGAAENATDRYLIATSEQPLSCLHADEWLQPSELPIKYCGYSTCFRKEAGSHGRDAWGIFRVHQFEKVEQFILCQPDESWKHFDEMIATSEEFYKSLKLPYRVVGIVSGALNNAAAKKFDLEAWFPNQSEYKELVSCSNCTDYQTRELEIRYGVKKNKNMVGGGKKEYVHALNATLCATERTLCCLLENYQREDGIEVPAPLRKYIPGQPEFLPFVRDSLGPTDVVTAQVPDAQKKTTGKAAPAQAADTKKKA